ncbi:MAG TPA: MATE family efflux transporter [Acidimicrobiaceae bacterium]|nr:MATE family efflux transporter [Acidimicrobiaceae bacterium]
MFRPSPYDRAILTLAVPALGALVSEPLYVLTDTAIVGRLGTDQLAGLALAAAVLVSLHAVFIFLAYGTTGIVGRLLGSGGETQAAAQGVQALWLALVLGSAVAVVVAVFAPTLLGLFGAEPAVESFGVTYLRISLVGLPAQFVVLAGNGFLRGMQNTVTPLALAVGAAVVNLVVELWMVFGLDMGIAGSAWSTVVAQLGAAAVYCVVVGRAARARGASLLPRVAGLARYARVGLLLLVRTSALRGAFLLAVFVAAGMGTVEVAAHQIALEVWGFMALSLDAVAIAGQALVARALGAGDTATARAAGRRMVGLSIQVGVVLGAAVAASAVGLATLFSNDVAVTSLTTFLLFAAAAMQPLNAVAFALDGVLIGAGDLAFLAKAMVGAFVVFAVCAVAVAVAGLGLGWLWVAIAVFMAARAAPLARRFSVGDWLRTGV